MSNRAKVDPFLMHELLHGISLVNALLESAAGGEVYVPAWKKFPDAKAALDRAEEALEDLYQAIGQAACRNDRPDSARKGG